MWWGGEAGEDGEEGGKAVCNTGEGSEEKGGVGSEGGGARSEGGRIGSTRGGTKGEGGEEEEEEEAREAAASLGPQALLGEEPQTSSSREPTSTIDNLCGTVEQKREHTNASILFHSLTLAIHTHAKGHHLALTKA